MKEEASAVLGLVARSIGELKEQRQCTWGTTIQVPFQHVKAESALRFECRALHQVEKVRVGYRIKAINDFVASALASLIRRLYNR